MKPNVAALLTLLLLVPSVALPTPTASDLTYEDRQVGAFFQFNIGEYGENTNNYACAKGPVAASEFAPQGTIDTDNWLSTVKLFGGKVAQLTTQAGCGFLLWPTEVKYPQGGPLEGLRYNYTVRESGYQGVDLVKQFVQSCHAAGVAPALYYVAGNNKYCNVASGIVASGGGPCGDQDSYNALVLAHLSELWSNYGSLAEIWFDGGVPKSQLAQIGGLVNKLQPQAVVFGGYGLQIQSPVKWIGTESGHAPAENWDLDALTAGPHHDGNGAGTPNGTDWVPGECDVSFLASGAWYWHNGTGQTSRTLQELQSIYEQSVGRSCYLNLGVHPDFAGNIVEPHRESYAIFGAWIRSCYESPAAATTQGRGTVAVPLGGAVALDLRDVAAVNRIVIEEDIAQGQRIRGWRVEAASSSSSGGWSVVAQGEAIGHKRIVAINTTMTTAVTSLRLVITALAANTSSAAVRLLEARNCSFA